MNAPSLKLLGSLVAASLIFGTAKAQQVDLGERSVLEIGQQLKPGEYVWSPELSADGTALAIVNLETQKLVLFRGGVPIGASTVSSGSAGHETPTGVFTILQKRQEHYSSTYNNAPMPNMQRLTQRGIALHAGKLPGYPASHGCIRLPHKFSALLFGATTLGMTVVITSIPAVPQASDSPEIATEIIGSESQPLSGAPFEWHPEREPEGALSVIISSKDQRAIVMRNGVEIGSAPVRVTGPRGAIAYVLRSWDDAGKHWLKLQFSGPAQGMDAPLDEGRRFDAPVGFRRAVATAVRPGSVVIVTPESLQAGSPGRQQTVIEAD